MHPQNLEPKKQRWDFYWTPVFPPGGSRTTSWNTSQQPIPSHWVVYISYQAIPDPLKQRIPVPAKNNINMLFACSYIYGLGISFSQLVSKPSFSENIPSTPKFHVGFRFPPIVIFQEPLHLDVSENSGTPKSSILIGFSILNHPFWGTPIFGNTRLVPPLSPMGIPLPIPSHVMKKFTTENGSIDWNRIVEQPCPIKHGEKCPSNV